MHTYSMELDGRTLTMEIGKIAKQANGAVLVRYGDTAVVVAVTGTKTPREGVDFFPLTVDFEEKMALPALYLFPISPSKVRSQVYALVLSMVNLLSILLWNRLRSAC